jgi:mediator of RNA polymerase II transcription subunit 5
LFGSYPGDPTLQSYLRQAIEENVISLTTFVSTFLSAARTPAIQSPATLDRLCKVALEAHYASKMPPLGSIVPLGEAPINVLAKIHDAMLLLKMAFTFPTSDFHHLTLTASELLLLLYSCASDFSQLSTGQAMSYFTDTADLLQIMRISPALRQGLEAFALSLSLVLADDAKVAREAQMMHPIQMSLGNKVEPFSITSENDTVTFSLFFHHLVR